MDLEMRIVGQRGISSSFPNDPFIYSARFRNVNGNNNIRGFISPDALR
ncbi:hypothetical protein [Bacillus thuringiensis]|nr:hypothetical protein [Bacillus thuringiensis]